MSPIVLLPSLENNTKLKMIESLRKSLAHLSNPKVITIVVPDLEGDKELLEKIIEIVSQVRLTYPNASIKFHFIGDATDKLASPQETLDAAMQMVHQFGNRDGNWTRNRCEIEAGYVNFVYRTLKKMHAQGGAADSPYAEFYQDGRFKVGDALLKVVEENKSSALRYTIPNTNNETLGLPWIDPPAGIDFATFVDKELTKFGLTWDELTENEQLVLYTRHMQEYTRGAVDAFFYWAIALAEQAAEKNQRSFSKKEALAQYAAYKDIKHKDLAQEKVTYLTLRNTLNAAFGLTGNNEANPLKCSNSFEEPVLAFFKNPKQLIDYVATAEIVHVIGEEGAKNKIVLSHGGFIDIKSFSLFDGQPAAKTVAEYKARFNVLRDRFKVLYGRYESGSLTIEENTELVRLEKGFALMCLPVTALRGASLRDFPELKASSISVAPNQMDKETIDRLKAEGIRVQGRGHQPVFLGNKVDQMQDPEFIGLEWDNTNYNQEKAAVAGLIVEHETGEISSGSLIQNKQGKLFILIAQSLDKNGARVWPEDAQEKIIQQLQGKKVVLDEAGFEQFKKNNANDPRFKRIEKLDVGQQNEIFAHIKAQSFTVQHVEAIEAMANDHQVQPAYSILCMGAFYPVNKVNDGNPTHIFMGFRFTLTQDQVMKMLDPVQKQQPGEVKPNSNSTGLGASASTSTSASGSVMTNSSSAILSGSSWGHGGSVNVGASKKKPPVSMPLIEIEEEPRKRCCVII